MLVPMGGREEPRVRPEEAVGTTVVVCGRIALYGNEPHTYVGLLALPEEQSECTGGENALTAGRLRLAGETVFRIEGELASGLESLQSRRASVVGVLEAAGEPPAPPASPARRIVSASRRVRPKTADLHPLAAAKVASRRR